MWHDEHVTEKLELGISQTDTANNRKTSGLAHYSPITHGMLKIDLELADGLITAAQPVLGTMHRGAEKLFESRDYRQILVLANRHEWLSAYSGELGVAQIVEQALGLDVPEHAQWLRALLLEVNRVTSHLAFVAGFPWSQAQTAKQMRELREVWITHFQQYSGSRMHPMLTRVGGVTNAPSLEWLAQLSDLCVTSQELLVQFTNEISRELSEYSGIAVISRSAAVSLSLTGPVARASGYDVDIRKNNPQLKTLDFEILFPTHQSDGDVRSRIQQLIDEVGQSLILISKLAEKCSAENRNEVNVLLPKVLRVPEGEYEHSIETPLGIASWFLVSRGDKMPYRLKLRPASLHTVLALSYTLLNQNQENLDAILASMPFVAGDVDR